MGIVCPKICCFHSREWVVYVCVCVCVLFHPFALPEVSEFTGSVVWEGRGGVRDQEVENWEGEREGGEGINPRVSVGCARACCCCCCCCVRMCAEGRDVTSPAPPPVVLHTDTFPIAYFFFPFPFFPGVSFICIYFSFDCCCCCAVFRWVAGRVTDVFAALHEMPRRVPMDALPWRGYARSQATSYLVFLLASLVSVWAYIFLETRQAESRGPRMHQTQNHPVFLKKKESTPDETSQKTTTETNAHKEGGNKKERGICGIMVLLYFIIFRSFPFFRQLLTPAPGVCWGTRPCPLHRHPRFGRCGHSAAQPYSCATHRLAVFQKGRRRRRWWRGRSFGRGGQRAGAGGSSLSHTRKEEEWTGVRALKECCPALPRDSSKCARAIF